jgi:hypothetical protein
MKNHKHIDAVVFSCLLCLLFGAAAHASGNSVAVPEDRAQIQTRVAETGSKIKRSASYTGYEVDGRTSASVLAAKRSHSVSKQDENGLAIFSGVFVIGLIVFFTQAFWKKH